MSKSKSPQGPSDKQPEDASAEQRPQSPVNQSAEEPNPAARDDAEKQNPSARDGAADEVAPAESEPAPEPKANSAEAAADKERDQPISGEAAPADKPSPPATEPASSDRKSSRAGTPTEQPTKPADKGPGNGRIIGISALMAALISAGMVGAAAYYFDWQQQEQTQEQAQTRLTELAEQTQQQQQAITELNNRVQQQRNQMQQALESQISQISQAGQQLQQQVQNRVQQQEAKISRLQDRLDGQQQRLANLSTTSREDWLLAEAEYLLKLANQRVLLERLPNNAIALLEAADAIVKQVAGGMGDAELFAVREALANELAALKRIEPVDKEGIYLRLNALANNVDDLPRVPGHSFEQSAQQEAETSSPESEEESSGVSRVSGWLQRAWNEVKDMAGMLDDYIKIEDAEAPVKPLVDQYTSQVAGLNVRLLMEQAQVALLKEQPTAYRQSLEQAQAMIDEYFIDSAPARELRQSLAQLQEVNIAPELPDISGSLKMLNNYIRQLHKLQPAAEGQL